MESQQHHQLKRCAVAYARRHTYTAVACEVRCPISRYRVDVAGFSRRPKPGRTLIVECKQSRADFIRDRRAADGLLRQRRDLLAEARLLDPGQALLFLTNQADQDLLFRHSQWVSHKQRRHVLKRLMQVERQLYGHAKFALMTRYCLADQLLIAAPTGLLAPGELPLGWGLLEFDLTSLDCGEDGTPLLPPGHRRVEPDTLVCQPTIRQRLVANIAVAATQENARLVALLAARRQPTVVG